MRQVRSVGAAAAGLAVVVLVSGCGGDGAGGEGKAAGEPSVAVTSSQPPTEVPPEPTVPEYPPTPQGEFDKLADAKGWVVDGLYGSASGFVEDICESLPVSAIDGASRPQWLVESGQMDGDGEAVLLAGVPKFCPKWTSAVKAAAAGTYERWFSNGTYVVSSTAPRKPNEEPPAEGEESIPPGTYRAKGRMEDCYWERTSKSGEILDNNFATSAREITVTIRESDGQFTSERCAVWKPVG
jgi:hypothetical protein